jgi:hypothetical protein
LFPKVIEKQIEKIRIKHSPLPLYPSSPALLIIRSTAPRGEQGVPPYSLKLLFKEYQDAGVILSQSQSYAKTLILMWSLFA